MNTRVDEGGTVEVALHARARRAYERGRLLQASRQACLLAPFPFLCAFTCAPAWAALVGGLALLGLGTALLWRGQAYARAVLPGALAGAAPIAAVCAALRVDGVCSMTVCWNVGVPACFAGGLLAGTLLGLRAGGQAAERGRFLASAMAVALLVGVPACVPFGLAGVAGMAVGMLAGAPAVLLRPARA